MSEKRQLNFSLPEELIAAFEQVAKRVSVKRKWMVCSAAVLLLLEAPEHIKDEYIQRAYDADNPKDGSFAQLVREAKAKAGRPAEILHSPAMQKSSEPESPGAKKSSGTSKPRSRLSQ